MMWWSVLVGSLVMLSIGCAVWITVRLLNLFINFICEVFNENFNSRY